MPSKCFKLNHKVDLPKNIAIYRVENKYLIIAPNKGTYIVLDTIQLQFFNYLKEGHTLNELLESKYYNIKLYPKLQDLLVQFEFRKFYESYQPNQNKHLHAHIYLTNACNLRCIHCYRYSGYKEKYEINFKGWKNILVKLGENGIKDVSISGGEPFIFNGIYELIDYAVDTIGMNVTVISNGTEIDFDHTSALKKLKGIQLSIDGPIEKINDEIRGKGVYCKVMRAIDILHSIGITVTLSMILFDKYFNEYKSFMASFLQKLKDKYGCSIKIHFATGILPGRNINRSEVTFFYNHSLQNFIDSVCEEVFGHEWLLHNYAEFLALSSNTNCGYGSILAIDPSGKIYPCTLPYYAIGDIFNDSILDVTLKLKKLNEKFSVDNLEPCSKCDIRYICGGRCRVMNRYLYDSMHITKCSEKYIGDLRNIFIKLYPFLYKMR